MHSTTTRQDRQWPGTVDGSLAQILRVLPDSMLMRYCCRILLSERNIPEGSFKCWPLTRLPFIRPTTRREQHGSLLSHGTMNSTTQSTCRKSNTQSFTNAEKNMI